MTQRSVPVVLSLFLVLGPLSGAALAADAPGAAAVPVTAPLAAPVKVRDLTLNAPGNGDTLATRRPAFTGLGKNGDTVTVWPADGDAYCTAAVAEGKWTCTPTRDLPVGQQILAVNETSTGVAKSQGLVRLRIFVRPDAGPTDAGPTDAKPCPE